jgi:hypothetical protein
MREKIEERLRELREELEVGRGMMAELDARRLNLNDSMLRIGGAVQVLEELLRDEQPLADGSSRVRPCASETTTPRSLEEV